MDELSYAKALAIYIINSIIYDYTNVSLPGMVVLF